MSDMGVAPGTDHTWLAKVLAGDPVACGVLVLARDLPDAELDALILRVKQIGVRVPAVDATATPWRERRLTPG